MTIKYILSYIERKCQKRQPIFNVKIVVYRPKPELAIRVATTQAL